MSKNLLALLLLFSSSLFSLSAIAHSTSPTGVQILDWPGDQIHQVKTAWPHASGDGKVDIIEGKHCITGVSVVFDISNNFAFDIDETVALDFEIDLENLEPKLLLQYDKNGASAKEIPILLPKKTTSRWHRQSIQLERARFADRSLEGFSESGDVGVRVPIERAVFNGAKLTLCNITLTRSYQSKKPKAYGDLSLNIVDENQQAIAARLGIYDETGKMVSLDKQAIELPYFDDPKREFIVAENRISWPHSNRRVFYSDKTFHARLPVGTYSIVVARGLEYRFQTKVVDVTENQETQVSIELSRWANMPAEGWYSGDPHIHAARSQKSDNQALFVMAQAEDVHVANVMQMGNVARSYFHQYAWGKAGWYSNGRHALVPGQEDPRTVRMGHTLHLNLSAPVRNPDRYYLYHEVFNAVHRQGGLSGYAHGGGRGLALQLPLDNVDFIEILQRGKAWPAQWFKALNLGFKLTPVSGSDYPYLDDVIGAVRTYVQVDKPYSTQEWFNGLKSGRTFVSNGPMLSLTVNGKGVGSDLHVEPGEMLTIEAAARLNPDIDTLDRLELVGQGKVIAEVKNKTGEESLTLTHRLKAIQGGWFVVRAFGKRKTPRGILAYSAPVYVTVGDSGFCDIDSIPVLVEGMKAELGVLLQMPVEEEPVNEKWIAEEAKLAVWPKNQAAVSERVKKSLVAYKNLLALAEQGECI